MRISDSVRKCVLFLGFEDDTPGKGGINCVGTGFLINSGMLGFIVTAKHVAHALGDSPFLVRLNRNGGGSENLRADQIKWHYHPNPTVDVAAIPFHLGGAAPYDAIYLPDTILASDALLKHDEADEKSVSVIGIGDLTYTVGLFRLMSGEKRNLPIVHSGNIAMLPGDEKIPLKDWQNPRATIFVEGYLIESQSLDGLSGSPVFVRPTAVISTLPPGILPDLRGKSDEDQAALFGMIPRGDLRVLGLWQGAWDAPPDDVLAIQSGRPVRVSVGVGMVVPAQRIIETLALPEIMEMKERVRAQIEEFQASSAASPELVMVRPKQIVADAPAEKPSSSIASDEKIHTPKAF
jgi:hypothetical protein